MRSILAFSILLVCCKAEQDETVALALAPPSRNTLEEWNAIIRGMRMDVLNASGEPVRQRVPALELRSTTAPTVLALWATYCPPCLEEIPMFNELYAAGHHVVGISMDSDNLEAVAKVLEEHSPKYPQGVLQTFSMKKVGRFLKSGVPCTVVLDRKGRVRYLFEGKTSKPELMAAIESVES